MDANVQMFIEHLKNHDVYPGYPPLSERWGVRKSTYRKWMRDGMPANTIAPGLYNHPCYLEGVAKGRAILDDGSKKFWDREFAPSFTGKYDHDANGRPLHPYTQQLLEAGLALEGPGFYWNYGPNLCADPVVIGASNDGRLKVILITRRDTAQLALPGGHIDPDEAPLDAALRELQEETTLDLLELPRGAMKSVELLYEGPVWDSRMTINAWPETTCFRA